MPPLEQLTEEKEAPIPIRILEITGVIVLAVLIGWGVLYYMDSRGKMSTGTDAGKFVPPPPPTKEEMIQDMSKKVANPPFVPEPEKQKMIDQMNQKLIPPTTATPGAPATAPAPAVTPGERQKMLDAMKQQAQ